MEKWKEINQIWSFVVRPFLSIFLVISIYICVDIGVIGIGIICVDIGVIGMSGFADAGGFLRCAGNCYPVKARRSYQDCFPLGERSHTLVGRPQILNPPNIGGILCEEVACHTHWGVASDQRNSTPLSMLPISWCICRR